jgi:predicted amino acid-binding ACT domain protein
MTTKENLAETIKKSRPNAKDSTIKMYVSNLMKLMKLFEKDNLKFLNKPQDISEKLSDLHYTTQRNYYNAIIVYLMSIEEDEDILKEYNDLRDDLNKKYEDEQATGTISDKQKDNFVDISEVNKMIEKMGEEIKEKKIKKKEDLTAKDKALLQVYIIYNIYTRIPLRNDISGMEVINKRAYNKLTESEKKEKNFLVINKNKMFFVINKFKTQSKYQELNIDIPKDLEKLLRIYIRINGMGVLFKSSTGKPLSRNALSQLLIKTSKKYMGKSISTTMLRKIYLSSKYAKVKEEMEKDAHNLGHSVSMQQSVYVKKPQEEDSDKEK